MALLPPSRQPGWDLGRKPSIRGGMQQADRNFHWKRLLLLLLPDILPLIARFMGRHFVAHSPKGATLRGFMATLRTSYDSQSCYPELNPQPASIQHL